MGQKTERLKVQNLNLTSRLIVRDTNPENKKWVKRGRGNLIISGTAEDTNLKLCMRIDRKGY